MFKYIVLLVISFKSIMSFGTLSIGLAQREITPPVGTPSAGYISREGKGMVGVHDPLLATALVVQGKEKCLVFCSLDHLGFLYNMTQEVLRRIEEAPQLKGCALFLGSTHTHSGGGAFLNIPEIGEKLAGKFDPNILDFYVEQTAQAILAASKQMQPAKIGIGYSKAPSLCRFRASYPTDGKPLGGLSLIKITTLEDQPLAALYNFAIHPIVLDHKNLLFSADLVGSTREALKQEFSPSFASLFFNGAQGDINPAQRYLNQDDRYESSCTLGQELAEKITSLWHETPTSHLLSVELYKHSYDVMKTAGKAILPLQSYPSEINLLVLNDTHAFVTIPGELSSVYDKKIQIFGKELGFDHVSIFGLTNDAHGYIILPEAYRAGTAEVRKAFGGEDYGAKVNAMVNSLLKEGSPLKGSPLKACGNSD